MALNSDVARHLDAFNITHNIRDLAHQTVISHLLIEPPRLASEGAARSRSWAKLTCKPVLSVSDYQAAMSDMIARDLIGVIDENKQAAISDYLAAAPAIGSVDGMPNIGTLQISTRFAKLLDELWASFGCSRPGVVWSRDWPSGKSASVYSPTRKGCFDFLRMELDVDEENPTEIESLSGPTTCGPWRCKWWHRFESGFVLDVRYV